MTQFNQRRDGWTPEIAAELERLLAEGKSRLQISRLLGCSKNAVVGRISRNALQTGRKKPPPYSQKQLALFQRLWTETVMAAHNIIEAVNAAGERQSSHQQLRDLAKRNDWHRPPAWRHANGKLVAKMRRERRKMRPVKVSLKNPPIPIPLREVYRLAAQLEMPRTQRDDINALNHFVRKQHPQHPGYVLADYQPTRLIWAQ